jgi:hypothetical protein
MSQPPNEVAPAPALRRIPRRYVALGLIILAIVLLGALVIVRDNASPTSSTVESFSAASSSLVSTLDVPSSAYDAVGVNSPANPVTPLHATVSAPLWRDAADEGAARPVLFFYGAEFAPYAAAQRWPVALALARFGTFNQLGLMQSTMTSAFPDLSTFTFWHVGYKSRWIALQSVERYSSLDPTGARYLALQTPDARQAAAVTAYGPNANSFALTDVANKYVLSGSAFSPTVLEGMTQDQIAGDLANPDSPLAQAVLAAANEITASICAVDGHKPGSVCESRGVLAADAALKITPPAVGTPLQ